MRAFVTGGTGFVGTNLVRELVARGWDVTAIHRKPPRFLDGVKLTLVEGDITDIESLRRAMPEGVDAVFNVAGDTTVWARARERQTRVNVDGTRNVAAVALEKHARRFVQTSSIAAFGRQPGRTSEETPSTALQGFNYERTKYLGELEVDRAIERGLDAVIINPPNIVGPYDTTNWARLVRMVVSEKLPGIPPGRASWSHVREVARAHIAAAERGRTGERYLLGGVDASYLDAVQTIGAMTGKRVPKKAVSAALLQTIGFVSECASYLTGKEPDITSDGATLICASYLSDCSKAKRELDYRVVSLDEMFRDCYEWMRSSGVLAE